MSRLREHQVKSIMRQEGLAVPAAERCSSAAEVARAAAALAGPVFVKAQIEAGDRGAAGGVLRADDPEAAREAAQRMFDHGVLGLDVSEVLVEQAVEGARWSGYVGVSVVEDPPRRVVLFSRRGGAGFDPSTAEVELDVEEARQPFRVRRALRQAGVPSEELLVVSDFLGAIAEIAVRWAAYTWEVNPCVFLGDRLVALDGKADLDDYSRASLPDPDLVDDSHEDPVGGRELIAQQTQRADHRGSLRYVQLIDESVPARPMIVGSHAVGGGESMVLLDAAAEVGLEPANYCDTSGSPSVEKVATAARLVAGQPHVAGLLFCTCIANQRLSQTATGLVAGWREAGWRGPTVARFAGNESEQARATVRDWAAEVGAPIVVLDEDANEWDAAAAMAALLAERDTEVVA